MILAAMVLAPNFYCKKLSASDFSYERKSAFTVPKSGSNIAQQYVDGFAFFHVHCCTKSQENLKSPRFSILKFPIRKKMCMFYSSSWMIFLKFKRQAI